MLACVLACDKIMCLHADVADDETVVGGTGLL